MIKNKISVIETGLYVVFIVATIIVLYSVYKKTDNQYAMAVMIGYIIITILFGLYLLLTFIINVRRLKWVRLKKNLREFFILFVLIAVSNYLFDYFFRPYKIDILREASVALGLSFLISFYELFSLKK